MKKTQRAQPATEALTYPEDGRRRVVIEGVRPELDAGRYPVKRIVGEELLVAVDMYTDGHDCIRGEVLFRADQERQWQRTPLMPTENDRWQATVPLPAAGFYVLTVEGWVDQFATWQRDIAKKYAAGVDVRLDLIVGSGYLAEYAKLASGPDKQLLSEVSAVLRKAADIAAGIALSTGADVTALAQRWAPRPHCSRYGREIPVLVEPALAGFSAWYEFFPRSASPEPGRHGTLRDCAAIIEDVARLGFTVVYLPPLHPIGERNRKGANNAVTAQPGDPGSPWAIGSRHGGHTAIAPELGTLRDFQQLVRAARELGVAVAMDLALQCAPDHPYVSRHPQWFRRRPDGTIQYAENPPKKYEDIVPFDFETDDWQALWQELLRVVLFWCKQGVRVFRVDNPHTKPFAFWEWLIRQVKRRYPETLFLSEAFTRPKIMYQLAKLGFSQSYTYFTWRNTRQEFTDYLTELHSLPVREFFRPNFWPNTPDILPGHLQWGGRPAFIMRLVLAATLSANYGVYGPAFELCVGQVLAPGKEEYRDSEKYQWVQWNRQAPGNIRDVMARVNQIRRDNPALQHNALLWFYPTDNEQLLCYARRSRDGANTLLIVVNLDPLHTQSGWVTLSLAQLGIAADRPYMLNDLLGGDRYVWQGPRNYVELNPHALPAHVLRVHTHVRRENDFDYFA